MSANRLKQIIGYRLQLSKYGALCSIIEWNPSNGKFTKVSNPYLNFNTELICKIAMYGYTLEMGSYTYLKERETSLVGLAVDLMGIAMLFASLIICFIYKQFNKYAEEYASMLNEMFNFLDKLQEDYKAQSVESIQKFVKVSEVVLLTAAISSAIIPVAFGAAFCADLEPSHRMMQYLFEIDCSTKLRHLPVLMLAGWLISFMAMVVYVTILGGVVHILLIQITTACMFPECIHTVESKSCGNGRKKPFQMFQTSIMGVLNEETIIRYYRFQQLLSSRMNAIYGCFAVSVSHVELMAMYVILSYGYITVWEELINLSWLALILPLCGFVSSLLIEYFEAMEVELLVDAKGRFLRRCRSIVPRITHFGKFAMSCPKHMTYQIAYPFYSMSKETFPQFVMQGMDFIITLLSIQV